MMDVIVQSEFDKVEIHSIMANMAIGRLRLYITSSQEVVCQMFNDTSLTPSSLLAK